MDTQMTDTVLIALCSGALCIAIGVLATRLFRPSSQRNMETQLQEAEQKLQQKNTQVAEHFTHTAALVSNLTRNYRDLHDYLASSAQQLGNIDIQPVLLNDNKSAPILGQGIVINPPLDYSPKINHTLSEAYGLKDDSAENTSAPNPYGNN